MIRYILLAVAIVLIVIAIVFYFRWRAAKAAECSQQIYANDPMLFNQWYCLESTIAEAEEKIADANNKISQYQSKINSGVVSPSLTEAIKCQQNYIAHLTRMLDIYNNTSRPTIEEQIIGECGAYYPVDLSTPENNGGIAPNCKTVLLPGVLPADLKPKINCALIT